MINKDLFHHFKTFLSKIRKHGFTLAEALIITVMTGYCLLPILGTMQNAQNRTQEYDHQSKMQMYTRSRLTEEIANAAFDHTSVNTTDEYHYIIYLASGTKATEGKEKDAILMELPKTTIKPSDLNTLLEKPEAEWSDPAMKLLNIEKAKCKKPYIKIVNLYKTSVETNNTPSLEYNGVSSTETETPKALLGIVVKTCLVQSNDDKYDEKTGKLDSDESVQVPPFTLFSFVNLPVVSDETIWLADALNCKIYGVDPISHGVNTIQLPTKNSGEPSNGGNNDYRPLSIAVHPNLKLLACLTKKCLYLINIDKKGNNYGDYYEYHKFSDEGLHYHDQQAYKFIKFRPDGKYLFLSPIHAKDFTKHAVVTFEITCTFESSPNKLDWEPDNATPKPALRLSNVKGSLVNDKTIVSLLPANDGNLYV
ncbi:MAG: hypothetical protein J6Z11_03670, partial [Candidatus Riflebacteria bacterium]|nr:hypothetical protein [Candidatus Riflebacteria bacterium]